MRYPVYTASLLTLIAACPALAQTATPTAATEDEIVISANLIPLDQDRTGVKVAVVDDEDLRKAGQAPLTDTLARLPGVTVTRNGGFGTSTTVRIRGAEGYYVPVYIDGILVSDTASTQPAFDMGAMMTADVGRIEVLYGSQSALYGGGAVGGVINIDTRAAIEEGRHTRFALEAGSDNTRAASLGFTEKTDRVEQALTLSHLHTDGFSASSAGTEDDGAEATRLSYSTRYQLSDTVAVGAAAFLQRGWNDYDMDPIEAGVRAHRREAGGRVFVEHAAGASTHRFELSTYAIKRRYESGLSSAFEGDHAKLAYVGSSEAVSGLRLVYGADMTRDRATLTALVGGERATTTSGLFGQALWTPRDGLDLSLTLRADHNSDFGDFVTGRLAAAYAVSDALVLRASLGTGFRPPSLSERYAVYDAGPYGIYRGNPDLKPEESTSLDLGLDWQVGGAQVSASVFQIKTDNMIDYRQSGKIADVDLYLVSNLPGTTTRKGVELSGEWAISDRVDVTGSYTYLDATDSTGARLNRIPRHDLGLGLEARLSEATSARIDLRHASGLLDRGTEMDGFTVVNIGATHALSDTAEAYVRVENLFDEDYQVIKGYSTPGRSVYAGLRARF